MSVSSGPMPCILEVHRTVVDSWVVFSTAHLSKSPVSPLTFRRHIKCVFPKCAWNRTSQTDCWRLFGFLSIVYIYDVGWKGGFSLSILNPRTQSQRPEKWLCQTLVVSVRKSLPTHRVGNEFSFLAHPCQQSIILPLSELFCNFKFYGENVGERRLNQVSLSYWIPIG